MFTLSCVCFLSINHYSSFMINLVTVQNIIEINAESQIECFTGTAFWKTKRKMLVKATIDRRFCFSGPYEHIEAMVPNE